MLRRRVCPSIIAALGVLASGLTANADPPARTVALAAPGVRLDWTAPESCPTRAGFLARISERIGRRADVAETLLETRVSVTSSRAGQWRLQLDLAAPDGVRNRVLEGETCEQVAEAGALVLALILDPDAGSTPPIESVPATRVRPAIHYVARAYAAGDLGSLPAPAFAAGFALGMTQDRFRVEFFGGYWFPRRAMDRPVAGAGADVELFSFGVRGCYAIAAGSRAQAGLCAAIEGGAMTATGYGSNDAAIGTGQWVMVSEGLFAALSLTSRIALRVSLDAGLTLLRPRFVIDEDAEVFRTSPLVARASAGLEVNFQ